jgi:hypothetical protein
MSDNIYRVTYKGGTGYTNSQHLVEKGYAYGIWHANTEWSHSIETQLTAEDAKTKDGGSFVMNDDTWITKGCKYTI